MRRLIDGNGRAYLTSTHEERREWRREVEAKGRTVIWREMHSGYFAYDSIPDDQEIPEGYTAIKKFFKKVKHEDDANEKNNLSTSDTDS